jgi:HEAT repeat protein
MLVEALKSDDTCDIASDILVETGSRAAPELAKLLRDRNEDTRLISAITLGRMGTEAMEAVPALIEALKDSSTHVRGSAAFALGETHTPSAACVEALTSLLDDGNRDVRAAASDALKRLEK